MAVAPDRLSELPNSILSLILSKLPIRDTIKCSVLSKRWRFLYTEIPDLSLSPYHLLSTRHLRPAFVAPLWSTIENRIFDILRVHSSALNSFDLSMGPRRHSWDLVSRHAPRRFTPKHVLKWLRCVARKNVKRLSLNYSYEMETPPPSLFSCTRLTVLKLKTCILTTFPTDFSGFSHLTKCTLRHITMTDDPLARLLSHCPLLRKFNFMDCVGLQNPVISALNLRDLVLQFNKPQPLTVNCPKLRTLKANMSVKDLRLNGLKFCEISPRIESLQMESGSNLIELRLHSRMRYNFSVSRFLELVGTLRSLKVLVFHLGNEDREVKVFPKVVPLFNLVSRLPNLERLHLRGKLILEESEGDPMPPSLTDRLAKLQFVEIGINKYDARELDLLRCLLQIAPALKEVILQPTRGSRDKHRSFFEMWGYLKKCREQGMLSEEIYETSFRF
eukprot:PITA_35053